MTVLLLVERLVAGCCLIKSFDRRVRRKQLQKTEKKRKQNSIRIDYPVGFFFKPLALLVVAFYFPVLFQRGVSDCRISWAASIRIVFERMALQLNQF